MCVQRITGRLVSAIMATAVLASTGGASAEDVYRIGVLAKRGAEKCLTKWTPTADYLSEKTGKTFVIQPLKFDAVPKFLGAKKVDFFLVNSSMYCTMKSQFGGEAIASLVNKRQNEALSQFGGVLFVKADSPITSLEDIKGKRFMCAKASSFGGYQMAKRVLLQNGINPETDCSLFKEAGTHDKVVEMVQKGVIEVGTVRSDTLERMEAEGKCSLSEFRILGQQEGGIPFVHSTQLYPEWPMAQCAGTDPAVAAEVAEALIAMPSESPAAGAAKCVGWCAPLDYSSVEGCLLDIR